MKPFPPNLNHVWTGLIVEELVRQGVTYFCFASGSRCSPLTTAAARHGGVECSVHLDERGNGFRALGYARATGCPAVVVTTSGTAAANLVPAAAEAAQDGIPMILLTADRPPELHDTGANQAMPQVDLYASFVRGSVDLPCPSIEVSPQYLLTTLDQAVYRATREPAGPVHINCPFREPLSPESDGADLDRYLSPLALWQSGSEPYSRYSRPVVQPDAQSLGAVASRLNDSARGIVLAGGLRGSDEAEAVLGLARKLGWPVLADITSGLRFAMDDLVLGFGECLVDAGLLRGADAVLHAGGRFVSKALLQNSADNPPALVAHVDRTPNRLDPAHLVTHRLEGDVCGTLGALQDAVTASGDPAWLTGLQQANSRVSETLSILDNPKAPITEPAVARLLAHAMSSDHGLFLANSMPVRDAGRFAAPRDTPLPTAANRGVSGIDGTISSALGWSEGLGAPVTLLIGDLACLHDLNALKAVRDATHPMTIVVVNNDGGGIFHFLPIVGQEDIFEKYYGTPHGLTFGNAAAQFDLVYRAPASMGEFRAAYDEAAGAKVSSLIEVRTDRGENRAFHAELATQCIAAATT
jgi:2-succinyl-5-enolpyruvyl-6-hydroxy-3-cyclohexene-1-carboxylate synthase